MHVLVPAQDILTAITANAGRIEEDRRRVADLAATVEQQRKQLAAMQAQLASGGACNCSSSGGSGSKSKKKKTGRR